jgi:hypothetical protein
MAVLHPAASSVAAGRVFLPALDALLMVPFLLGMQHFVFGPQQVTIASPALTTAAGGCWVVVVRLLTGLDCLLQVGSGGGCSSWSEACVRCAGWTATNWSSSCRQSPVTHPTGQHTGQPEQQHLDQPDKQHSMLCAQGFNSSSP